MFYNTHLLFLKTMLKIRQNMAKEMQITPTNPKNMEIAHFIGTS